VRVRAAIYCRVSSQRQAEKYGADAQLHDGRAFCASRDYEIAFEFVDKAKTGTNLDRPEMDRLREVVRDHRVDRVVFPTLGRLSRERLDQLLIERELRQAKVGFDYVNLPGVDDSPEGDLIRGVFGEIEVWDRKNLLRKMMAGKLQKARRGLLPSGPIPFGYRPDPTQPGGIGEDPNTGPILKSIFAAVLDGRSLNSIVKWLNEKGIPSPQGRRWQRSTVNQIAHSEIYAGRGNWGGIAFAVPPLLPPGTFERVQEQIKRNRVTLQGKPTARPSLLRGLLVCGLCGTRMHARAARTRVRYVCPNNSELAAKRCHASTRSARIVDQLVCREVERVLRDPAVVMAKIEETEDVLEAHQGERSSTVAMLKARHAAVRKERARLLDEFAADGDPVVRDAIRERARAEQSLAAQIVDAEAAAAAAAGATRRQGAIRRRLALIMRGLDRLDLPGWARLLRLLVDKVVVFPDRLEMHGVVPSGVNANCTESGDAASRPPGGIAIGAPVESR
jgi:site-specific DNA recombinase